MIQLYLPIPRYNEIKYEVLFMYEECEIETFPIDCFEIARRLYYHLVPYSCLPDHALRLAMQYSPDGFSTIYHNPNTRMYEWYIFYNDYNCFQRQRWTIFHEIGHIYLGHFEDDFMTYEEKESEANFFAKYSIAPPPLINITDCKSPSDIADNFYVSGEASVYIFTYFQKWKNYGPLEYEPFEIKMLEQFHVA